MQGVRTTRGCINCRRRKKGCDFRRPTCSRCQQLHIACAYEERKFTFVDRSESPPNKTTRPPPGTAAPGSLTGASHNALARTVLELQTEAGFWNIYLSNEDPALDGSVGGVLSAPWIPTMRALAAEDVYLRTAVNACAFACLGWMREDYDLIRHGTRLYSQALRETNIALQDPVRVQSDSLLACCRVLGLFEMFRRSPGTNEPNRPQTQDWQKHIDGTCRIIRLRGREKHISGKGRDLYDGVRITAVILGLVKRRPNEFTSLTWILPPQNSLRDELFDFMRTVPDLFQQCDLFSARLARIVSAGDVCDYSDMRRQGCELVQRCTDTGIMLRQWELKAINVCRQITLSQRGNRDQTDMGVLEDDTSLRGVCQSHGDGFFFICAQYWAMCLKVYSSVRLFHRQVSTLFMTTTPGNGMPPLAPWMNPEPHALNIADTTDYYFRPGAGLWSAQSAVFPVGNALYYFARTGRRDSPIFKKMTDAFAESKEGAVMRDFVLNIAKPDET